MSNKPKTRRQLRSEILDLRVGHYKGLQYAHGFREATLRAAEVLAPRRVVPFTEAITGLIEGKYRYGRGLDWLTDRQISMGEHGRPYLQWEGGEKYSPGEGCLGRWEVFYSRE